MADKFPSGDGLINDSGVIACEVNTGETVVIGNVVKVAAESSDDFPKIAVASADDVPLGVVVGLGEGQSGGAGKKVSVALCGSGKVVKVVAGGSITVGTPVKTANNGKVQAWAGTPSETDVKATVGIALHAASNDGDEILVALK